MAIDNGREEGAEREEGLPLYLGDMSRPLRMSESEIAALRDILVHVQPSLPPPPPPPDIGQSSAIAAAAGARGNTRRWLCIRSKAIAAILAAGLALCIANFIQNIAQQLSSDREIIARARERLNSDLFGSSGGGMENNTLFGNDTDDNY